MFAGTALAETGGSVGDNFGVHCNLSAPIQVGVLLGLTGDNYSCNTPTVPTVPGSLPGGV
jgi:hypothetical protein